MSIEISLSAHLHPMGESATQPNLGSEDARQIPPHSHPVAEFKMPPLGGVGVKTGVAHGGAQPATLGQMGRCQQA